MEQRKKLVVILGPTAVGKTALAIRVAQHFKTEIISADSRQFFHELNIGVARPSIKELSAVPHHFIDFISVEDHYSAGAYERDALDKVATLFSVHDVVVCCGGSMMYIDALTEGLDELPSDKAIREDLNNDLVKNGKQFLQQKLLLLDPDYYAMVDTENPHRIIRALEVCMITGKKYSELRTSSMRKRNFDIVMIGLSADRTWLYDRINKRVDEMMNAGLLDEAKHVYAMKNLNALNTVGYKELFDFLEGKCSLPEAVAKIKQHTRNFAKRQLTWWRRDEEIHWIGVDVCDDLVTAALRII